ncbi:APC family permease [Mycoplasmoides pirum]|uniref:APC family permease n=1 Tax=Mycoplasmoides pirum TaxID=2122 RepID=UPI0006973200|nr:APC family permease [Mycoplasmoides pirum]
MNMNNDVLVQESGNNSNVSAAERSLANAPTSKKIGFISAIAIVIGSSVGAGIFFKSSTVLAYSGSNLIWAIFSWVIAAFAVICMALALIEIASARNDNLSMIGWCKEFNGKYIYKGCKYFMTFIYLPLTFFFMPIYVIVSLQDALAGFNVNNNFGTSNDWAIWMIIILAISIYFIFVCGLSSKATNIQNWIITALKFIPLVVVAILGFVLAAMPVTNTDGTTTGGINNIGDPNLWNGSATNLFELTPFFGTFGAMAAIFFAFDGFYVTAGLQSEMREPKKTPKAIFIGLVIVTVIYLIIAVSMSLGSAGGSFYSFQDWLKAKNVGWLFGVINILIAVGVLGIINGFAAWAPRFVEDLIKEGELVIPSRTLLMLNRPQPILGTLYTFTLSVPVIIVFCIIGGLGYFPGSYAGAYDGTGFSSQAKLINFADLMATWVSLFAFAFIAFAIFGGLMNRKTNRVATQRNSYFKFTGWVSFVLVALGLIFSVAQPFVNLGLVGAQYSEKPNELLDPLIGNLLLCVILFLFAGICFGPVYFEEKIAKNRLNKLNNVASLMNYSNDQIVKTIQPAILNNDWNLLAEILVKEFNIEESYVQKVIKYTIISALKINKKKHLLQLESSHTIFNNETKWILDKEINLTKSCIDSCNTKHWYFVKKAPVNLNN